MPQVRTLVSLGRRTAVRQRTRVVQRAVCSPCGKPSDRLWWYSVGDRVRAHEQWQLVGECCRRRVEAY